MEKYLLVLGFNYFELYKEDWNYHRAEVRDNLEKIGVYFPVGNQSEYEEIAFKGKGLQGINIFEPNAEGKFVKMSDVIGDGIHTYFLTIRKDNGTK